MEYRDGILYATGEVIKLEKGKSKSDDPKIRVILEFVGEEAQAGKVLLDFAGESRVTAVTFGAVKADVL